MPRDAMAALAQELQERDKPARVNIHRRPHTHDMGRENRAAET